MKYLFLAALAALPAVAGATPIFLPTQDVAISYQLSAPGRPPATYQLSYDAADQLARIDAPTGYYILGNLPAGQAVLVIPNLNAIVQAPDFSALTVQIHNADGARFTPLGPGHYAGLDCTKYLILAKQGTGTACLTPTGVVLHFAGHDAQGSAEITALSVTYAPPTTEHLRPTTRLQPTKPPPRRRGRDFESVKGQAIYPSPLQTL